MVKRRTASKPRRSKYGVDISSAGKTQRTYKGRCYDSLKEMRYAIELDARLAAGEIASWAAQPRYALHAATGKRICTYVADFLVVYPDGRSEAVDVKAIRRDGTPLLTDVFRLKAKWYAAEYPDVPLVIK